MKEEEASIWCPRCKVYVGKVYRIQTDTGWRNESEPERIPKYCNLCDGVTERE